MAPKAMRNRTPRARARNQATIAPLSVTVFMKARETHAGQSTIRAVSLTAAAPGTYTIQGRTAAARDFVLARARSRRRAGIDLLCKWEPPKRSGHRRTPSTTE